MLEDFPERIEDESAAPLACTLPPRFDPHAPAAVAEARGLRPAYERQLSRSGRTNVGHAVDADHVSDAIAAIVRVADGTPIDQADLPGSLRALGLDIRAYYEEAAIALSDHVPGARPGRNLVLPRDRGWCRAQACTGRPLRGRSERSGLAFPHPDHAELSRPRGNRAHALHSPDPARGISSHRNGIKVEHG